MVGPNNTLPRVDNRLFRSTDELVVVIKLVVSGNIRGYLDLIIKFFIFFLRRILHLGLVTLIEVFTNDPTFATECWYT